MPGSWPNHEFPNLSAGDYQVTSPATKRYNCTAWAAYDTRRKWWPDPFNIGYWPPGVAREETVAAFIQAYGTLGFCLCFDGSLEPGVQKLVIFTKISNNKPVPTHAALQLESGHWTSKLGDFEDITHYTLESLNGPCYGQPECYLARPRDSETL